MAFVVKMQCSNPIYTLIGCYNGGKNFTVFFFTGNKFFLGQIDKVPGGKIINVFLKFIL